MKSRLLIALGSYAVLALMALLTLDRLPRIAVWLVLVALAVKTLISAKHARPRE